MATVQRRSGPSQAQRDAMRYIALTNESTALKKKADALKPTLLETAATLGLENDGHRDLLFPEPVEIDGVTYKGLRRERRAPQYFDESKSREILEKKGLTEKVVTKRMVEVEDFDQNEVYVLHQEGLLTEEEMDAMLTTNETFALVKVKA